MILANRLLNPCLRIYQVMKSRFWILFAIIIILKLARHYSQQFNGLYLDLVQHNAA